MSTKETERFSNGHEIEFPQIYESVHAFLRKDLCQVLDGESGKKLIMKLKSCLDPLEISQLENGQVAFTGAMSAILHCQHMLYSWLPNLDPLGRKEKSWKAYNSLPLNGPRRKDSEMNGKKEGQVDFNVHECQGKEELMVSESQSKEEVMSSGCLSKDDMVVSRGQNKDDLRNNKCQSLIFSSAFCPVPNPKSKSNFDPKWERKQEFSRSDYLLAKSPEESMKQDYSDHDLEPSPSSQILTLEPLQSSPILTMVPPLSPPMLNMEQDQNEDHFHKNNLTSGQDYFNPEATNQAIVPDARNARNSCHFCFKEGGKLSKKTSRTTKKTRLKKCETCSRRTETSLLQEGEERWTKATGVPVAQRFECKVCGFKAKFRGEYRLHLGSVHPITYSCPHCAYVTTRKVHFGRHIRNVHEHRRPYVCPTCGLAFKRRDALKQHHVIHLKEVQLEAAPRSKVPFRCKVCQKVVRSNAYLREHMLTHSETRSFLCEICGASFKTRSVHRNHLKVVHSQGGRAICRCCGKALATNYSLKRHMRQHQTRNLKVL